MPWGRLDDGLYDHPKLDALGPLRLTCIGLHVVAISWCNRYLTDGAIPASRVRALGGTKRHAEALVEAGLWEHDTDGYRVHDFHDYNPSKAAVIAERRAWAERQAKSRRDSKRDSHGDSRRESSSPVPVPTPVPDSETATQPRRPPRPAPPVGEPRLTKEQLDRWRTFGHEWDGFKVAWLERGLFWPPAGEPDDGDTSQRGLLWQVLDARPSDLVRWVREAPKGNDPRVVIEHVITRWHEVRGEVADAEEAAAEAKRQRRDTPERASAILARLERAAS